MFSVSSLQSSSRFLTAWALLPLMLACLALVWFHCLRMAPTSLSPALASLPSVMTQEITFGACLMLPLALSLNESNVCSSGFGYSRKLV